MKLWQKDKDALKEVTEFTTGNDRALDLYLARFDVLGSLAHITMLESIGLLTLDELTVLSKELKCIFVEIEKGNFKPVIDRKYPLDKIAEAYTYVATGQKIGNVVITMDA